MAKFTNNPDLRLGQLSSPTAPLRLYGEHRLRAFRRQSNLGVNPYGQKYRPLSPWYAREKARRYGNRPILWATGRMLKSHRVQVIGSRFVESLDDPAVKHQIGYEVPKRPPMPDRRGLPDSDRQALWNAVVRTAREAFK